MHNGLSIYQTKCWPRFLPYHAYPTYYSINIWIRADDAYFIGEIYILASDSVLRKDFFP